MQLTFSVQAVRPIIDLIQQARQGVLRRRVDEVALLVGLTDIEMAHILNISVRGLHGKSATEPLTLAAGERLLLLERLVQHGLSVFDGRADLLSRWLRTPLAELAYREVDEETTFSKPNAAQPSAARPFSVQNMGSFSEPTEYFDHAPVSAETSASSALVPQSPLAMLDTVSGFSLAEDVLGRIEWGIAG